MAHGHPSTTARSPLIRQLALPGPSVVMLLSSHLLPPHGPTVRPPEGRRREPGQLHLIRAGSTVHGSASPLQPFFALEKRAEPFYLPRSTSRYWRIAHEASSDDGLRPRLGLCRERGRAKRVHEWHARD